MIKKQYENNLEGVIQLVRDKYKNDVNMLIYDDKIMLEYMYDTPDGMDVFKSIEVVEYKNKLKIKLIPEKIIKTIDIYDLEEIFEILHKQSTYTELSAEEIAKVKEKYTQGMKLKVTKIYDLQIKAPKRPVIVDKVDDKGQIFTKSKNGTELVLVPNLDEFEIIK